MECSDCQEKVSRFIDRELGADSQAELFGHMAGCAECRGFLESSVRIRDVMHGESESLPVSLDDRMFEQFSHRSTRGPADAAPRHTFWRRKISVPAPVAAVALVIAAVGVIMFALSLRTTPTMAPLEFVLGRDHGVKAHPAVILVYELPEEKVLEIMPKEIHETRARIVGN